MNVIGTIRILGTAFVNSGGSKYSIIEFYDGTILQEVYVPAVLDGFLQAGFNSANDTTLYCTETAVRIGAGAARFCVIGIRLSDGRSFIYKGNHWSLLKTMIWMLLLMPFGGFGFIFLIHYLLSSKSRNAYEQMQDELRECLNFCV